MDNLKKLTGFRWLIAHVVDYETNVILADVMGLGKTIQAIAVMSHLIHTCHLSRFLISVPLSIINNWMDEFKKFAPCINVIKFIGSKEEREELKERALNEKVASILFQTFECC